MRAPRQRLRWRVLLADGHQAGHLGLGDGDFLAAPVGEREVGDLAVFGAAAGLSVAFMVEYSNDLSERRV